MEDWSQTLGTVPLLLIAVGAIALILLLIIVFKVHAFLTLIIVSLLTAFAAQIPVSAIASTLTGGLGGTLGTVALLVALGAMLGRLIEHSGGAKALADKFVDIFGEKRAPFALGIASLILGFPMFFDAGLVMMLPIVFAVARRVSKNNVLLFGIPAAAAFSVMHVFLPPHPGPVTATELYGANLGIVLIVGLIIVFPTWYLSGYLWGKFVAKRIPLPVPTLFGEIDDDQPTNPPKPGTIVALLLLPMFLIFMNTGLTTLTSIGAVNGDDLWVQVLVLLGTSPVALLITVLVAMVVLGTRRGEKGSAIEKLVDSALGPVASVILITGAGGMFGAVLRASGIGEALADTLSDLGLPVIIAAYLIAVVIRLAQGSATVALVTAAGLAAPAVLAGDYNPLQVAAIVLATGAGSVFAGHVNDSGFWLVGRLMGMDVKTTLKTWTVQQAIESVTAFVFVLGVFGVASLI
ncbi:GntP family gluconate:H+ symporter [Microbacterium halimionae]|uniref:GntP family gluconate:H+ symporter n=1 Tax=Microbacterium halimionae TaxID=1526413 RepID=A0A7W3JPS9_9MICO|nr:GntP family permease [Microbacterium halimionae]MBA8816812.1 GntP family gluconate:H+ symporter [Microbacterium halimionae]NII94892.1 GntP family gluconate:H+ symporter [Microbacterium halimionae]